MRYFFLSFVIPSHSLTRRNVLDPGVEENVFRELDIPIPPDMADDNDDEDGDNDGDATSSTNSGSGNEQHRRQISGEISAMRSTASASATAAAAAATRGHDGIFPPSNEGASERVSGLRQRGSGSVLRSRGNSDGRRRGLLVPLEDTRRSRVTNGDIIRQFRKSAEAATANAAASFALHAHPSGSKSRAALESMREAPEGENHDAPQAVTSSIGSTVTAVTSSSNLGFAVFCDENDEAEVADPPSEGATSSNNPTDPAVKASSSSLGFAVFRDDDEDNPEVSDAPTTAEEPTQAALGFSVAQDAMDEDFMDDNLNHQSRGSTAAANAGADSHRRFSRNFGGRFGTDDESRTASGGQCSRRPSMEDVAQLELTYFEDDEGVEGQSTLNFFDDSPVRSS